jgi:hypothetical protein
MSAKQAFRGARIEFTERGSTVQIFQDWYKRPVRADLALKDPLPHGRGSRVTVAARCRAFLG